MGLGRVALGVYNRVLRAAFGQDHNRLAAKIDIPVAVAGINSRRDQHRIAVYGDIDRVLDGGEITGAVSLDIPDRTGSGGTTLAERSDILTALTGTETAGKIQEAVIPGSRITEDRVAIDIAHIGRKIYIVTSGGITPDIVV